MLQRVALVARKVFLIDVFLHLVGIYRLAVRVVVLLEHIAIVEIAHILKFEFVVVERDVTMQQFREIITRFGIGGDAFHTVEIHRNNLLFLRRCLEGKSQQHNGENA